MRFFRKQLFILTTILTLLASYVLPYISHASAAENYITVAQAIANNSGTATVKGYIVGYTTGTKKYQFTAPFSGDTNIAIADSPTETDPAKIMPVQLPSGELRTNFNLKTHPENLGKEVYITGSLEAYFTVPGLKSPTAISFTSPGGPADPPPVPTDGVKISAIQGEGHTSPYTNQTVKGVQGIVTQVWDADNFYMQDPNPDNNSKTSEGILVYKKGHGVAAGDQVAVEGTVKEWVVAGYNDKLETDLPSTEINATTITKLASGQPLPPALVIGKDIFPPTQVVDNDKFTAFDPEEDAIDFYESIEGMRVALENPVAVAPQRYGEVPVITGKVDNKVYTTPGGIPITKENMNPERLHLLFTVKDESFVSKTGDRFDGTVYGVVTYTFQNYKILTDKAALPKLVESDYKQEVTDIVKDANKLTVASYNMENYTKADPAKTAKIAESIVNNLKTPDIVGLVEVQDNNGEAAGGTDASQNYQALIDAIAAKGGPTYKWTDIEPVNNHDGGAPEGNIRVGFIYNPDRVSLKPGTKGTSTEAVGYENGALTLNPGRIDPANAAFTSSRKPLAAEFIFKGEDVIVIANHFNSKGGDQPIFGKNQPPVLGSEAKRVQIAGIVNNFIKDVKSKNADANVVVLGDLNDFEFSNPLTALKGNELTNLIEMVPAAERFTYSYQGNSQVLDHMLVSNNLAESSEVDIVHLNSPFTTAHGRVSDHDPVLTQINLKQVAGPKAIDLSIMHVNDTHANVEQYPKLTTAVNQVRAEKPNSLLVDAGDVFSGTLYFNQYLGKADLWFMNNLKYDAMTFGNHEFDRDSATLASFIGETSFPMVSANIDFSKDPVLGGLYQNEISSNPSGGKIYPAIVKTVDGEKVGIFGLTTEETTFLASPSKDLVFGNAVEKAKATVEALKAQGINKIVVLSHLGYVPDQNLAKSVDGIDVIVGGHSHTKLDQPVVIDKAEPTVIVQANEYLKYLGVLNVSFDENGVVTAQDGKLLDVNTYAQDAAALAKVNELKAPLEGLKQTVVGSSSVVLDGARANVRTKETNLGNLIADAMAEKANEILKNNTTIAMQNGGGIRASIDQGDVTLGEVLTVMPFANLLVTLDLTGEEIRQALEQSVSGIATAEGRFMQVAGLQYKFDAAKPIGDRVWEVNVKTANGYEPIDLTKTYSVATNAFVADGGDGYTVFKKAKSEGRIHELLIVDYEILSEYIAKNSPVSPVVEGRIIAGEEPQIQTGWVEIDGSWYYFNEKGEKVTGWLQLEGDSYYLDKQTGAMITGLTIIEGKKYFFAGDGKMLTGWANVNDHWYYFGSNGAAVTGWMKVSGKPYYFDQDGAMKTFWLELDGKRYYLGADGVMVTGFADIQGKGYYFDETGVMQTGWLEIAGKHYYLGKDGVMHVGWSTIDGDKYYFDENGVMQKGLILIGGKTYYFGYDGAMVTGWNFGDPWRYFGEDGAMVTGWLEFNGETHYFREDGSAVMGWYQIDGNLYYFSEYGIMAKGLYDVHGHIHYFGDNGVHQAGWVTINGSRYYLDEATGEFKQGWLKYDNNWFYQNNSGLVTGWAKIKGTWYYFDASGVMKTGWVKDNGKWYLLGASGSMVTGWASVDGRWYFLNSHGAMNTGWTYVNGHWYFMNTSGAMQTGWIYKDGKWYYLYANGKMAANTTIQGYKLGANGAWIR